MASVNGDRQDAGPTCLSTMVARAPGLRHRSAVSQNYTPNRSGKNRGWAAHLCLLHWILKDLIRRMGDTQFALSHLEPLSDSVLLARIVQGTVNYRGKFLKVRINLIEALKEDKSAIHNFVLFLIQVGVGMELDLRVILPLNRFKLVAFLLKEELHHFGMRSDTDAS